QTKAQRNGQGKEVERLWREGRKQYAEGKTDSAEKTFKAGLELAEQARLHNDNFYAAIRQDLALIYRDRGRYDRAIELYESNLKLYQYLSKTRKANFETYIRLTALTKTNLGIVYRMKWDLERAEEYFRESIPTFEQWPK